MVLSGSEFLLEGPIHVPEDRVLKGHTGLIPISNFDVIQPCGGSIIGGVLTVDTRDTPDFDRACLLYSGAKEDGGEATNFRPRKGTRAVLNTIGKRTGVCGKAVRFEALANNDRVTGVHVMLSGEGFDVVADFETAADDTKNWVTDCEVKFANWGGALQAVRMISAHIYSYGLDGNTIRGDSQPRDEHMTQTVPHFDFCGRFNDIKFMPWDWFNTSVPYIRQHPLSVALNEISDMTFPKVTLNSTGDTVVRSRGHCIYNTAAGKRHEWRQNGSTKLYTDANGKLITTAGMRVESGRLELTGVANPPIPGAPIVQVPITYNGQRIVLEGKPET